MDKQLETGVYVVQVREGFTKKSCCSFGFCPNYLPKIQKNSNFFFVKPSLRGVVVYLGKVDILHIRSASNVHLAIAKD